MTILSAKLCKLLTAVYLAKTNIYPRKRQIFRIITNNSKLGKYTTILNVHYLSKIEKNLLAPYKYFDKKYPRIEQITKIEQFLTFRH